MSGKEGFITKEGGSVLSWKKRYLAIERDRLSYYTKENKKTKKGEILLKTIKEVKRLKEYKSRRFVFGILTLGRTYFVQAPDDQSAQSWVDAISEALGRGPSSESEPISIQPTVQHTALVSPTQVTVKTNGTAPNNSANNNFGSNQNHTSNSNGSANNSANNGSANNSANHGSANNSNLGGSNGSVNANQNNGHTNNNSVYSAGNEKKVGLEDFDRLKVIGRGGFGKVLLVCKRDTKKVYAMKILKKADIAAAGEIEHTKTERNVLTKLTHPFLPKLHYSFQTDTRLFFVLDFVNGGELFHHLQIAKKFPEPRAKFYAAQIVCVLQYVHSNGIIYRDLKPENLLLSREGNIILTDFGLAKEGMSSPGALTSTFCGTPDYFAPEIIRGESYTKAVDWWSVGTLIYEMLNGLPPFYSQNEENMYHLIMTAELVIPSFFSPEVADLISKLLERDPEKRLQDAEAIKSHPWFKDINFVKLLNFEIPPPFIPDVKGEVDVGQIDEEFLEADVEDSDEEDDIGPTGDFGSFTFAAS